MRCLNKSWNLFLLVDVDRFLMILAHGVNAVVVIMMIRADLGDVVMRKILVLEATVVCRRR